MSKRKSMEQQKILVLTSLIFDYSDDFEEVNEICGSVLDDLYGKFKRLRKDNYIQVLSARFENTASQLTANSHYSNVVLYCCCLIMELNDLKGLSNKATKLYKGLEQMSNQIQIEKKLQNIELETLKKYKYKTDTIIRKNHIKINDKY